MPDLKGSKTHQNLKDAFAGESQANRRYLYFARQADIEGYTDAEEAVGQLQSWNFHVFMRPVGAAGHSILPSDIIFVEAPKPA